MKCSDTRFQLYNLKNVPTRGALPDYSVRKWKRSEKKNLTLFLFNSFKIIMLRAFTKKNVIFSTAPSV